MQVTTITYGFLLVGIGVGLGLYRAWAAVQRKRRKTLPNRWDLAPRGLVTVEEFAVWRWLEQAFHEHEIAVKTPVSRFTRARDRRQSPLWSVRLNGIYCTFCVCTTQGTVIGCVDVPGKTGLLQSSREIKENILTACGMAYAVVRGDNLPDRAAIRAVFLGEIPPGGGVAEEDSLPCPLRPVQDSLDAHDPFASVRKRRGVREERPLTFDPFRTDSGIVADPASDWEDSFLSSAESRPAALGP